jgi:uncharacterized membrane protein YecN with MAPEG domain
LLTVLVGYTLTASFSDSSIDLNGAVEFRLKLLAVSLMLPAVVHLISIARVAQHRFFCADDIDGSALAKGTPHVKLLQALLQNTLEQLMLAVCVYFFAALTLKTDLLALIPVASVLFFLGRILFFIGYAGGASSRAYGFALTFYSTVILGLISMCSFVRSMTN